jgi:arginyl-tRNA synthetase
VNVVSGRHAAVGDAISNLLEAAGHDVTREFYINDAGRQIDLFAESIAARYLQHWGQAASVPDDGYQGEYMKDIAAVIAAEVGDRYLSVDPTTRNQAMKVAGLAQMLREMRTTLSRFGTEFDVWFSEQSLHDAGKIEDAIAKLEAAGHLQERDGAKWFLSSNFGDDKDRVVVRSNGEPTYLGSDLPYLQDKFGRGFDHLVYLWGADHHGTISRLLAGAEALGLDRSAVEVRLVQIVSLLSGGEAVKASKRAGAIVPLDELIDDVGADAARYIFLSRSYDGPLEFDLALAKEQAPENPVYYVQYAHARICSILRKAEAEGVVADAGNAPLGSLDHPSEDQLMRKLASYEEVVPEAAEMRAPQRIARYIEELASDFSSFYRDCKVIGDDADLTKARLALCSATKEVIASALGLLGVSAPEKM